MQFPLKSQSSFLIEINMLIQNSYGNLQNKIVKIILIKDLHYLISRSNYSNKEKVALC